MVRRARADRVAAQVVAAPSPALLERIAWRDRSAAAVLPLAPATCSAAAAPFWDILAEPAGRFSSGRTRLKSLRQLATCGAASAGDTMSAISPPRWRTVGPNAERTSSRCCGLDGPAWQFAIAAQREQLARISAAKRADLRRPFDSPRCGGRSQVPSQRHSARLRANLQTRCCVQACSTRRAGTHRGARSAVPCDGAQAWIGRAVFGGAATSRSRLGSRVTRFGSEQLARQVLHAAIPLAG